MLTEAAICLIETGRSRPRWRSTAGTRFWPSAIIDRLTAMQGSALT